MRYCSLSVVFEMDLTCYVDKLQIVLFLGTDTSFQQSHVSISFKNIFKNVTKVSPNAIVSKLIPFWYLNTEWQCTVLQACPGYPPVWVVNTAEYEFTPVLYS